MALPGLARGGACHTVQGLHAVEEEPGSALSKLGNGLNS